MGGQVKPCRNVANTPRPSPVSQQIIPHPFPFQTIQYSSIRQAKPLRLTLAQLMGANPPSNLLDLPVSHNTTSRYKNPDLYCRGTGRIHDRSNLIQVDKDTLSTPILRI